MDEAVGEWAAEMPEMDLCGFEIGARIVVLDHHIEARTNRFLAQYQLHNWGFDVLAALLRSGPPYSLTPTGLMRSCFLSSGAVTNRLDRLEKRDLITRNGDTKDRRCVKVTLTEAGLELAREAIQRRLEYMNEVYSVLSEAERKTTVGLLRKLLRHLETLEDWKQSSRSR
ncbi:MAG: MarR family transcriptional regulator [Vulcanimicrobiota bacterium]